MYSALKRVIDPVNFPVTFDQVSAHLRLDSDTDEELVMMTVSAATEWIESYLDRALITTTYQYTLSHRSHIPNLFLVVMPLALQQLYTQQDNRIELPRSPVQSVTSINYNYTDGTASTVSTYDFDLSSEPAVLNLIFTSDINLSNLQITYVAGYGDTLDSIPASIRQAVLMLTAHLYEQRGDTDGDMPRVVTRLLSNYRLQSFA